MNFKRGRVGGKRKKWSETGEQSEKSFKRTSEQGRTGKLNYDLLTRNDGHKCSKRETWKGAKTYF
jgi:hypothetical protein